jgi:hypothetical protein
LRATPRQSSRQTTRQSTRPAQASDPVPLQGQQSSVGRPALIEAGAAASLSSERRDLICSTIGLIVKLGLVAVACVSVIRLAGAYRERMDRQGELAAVLQLEQTKLARSRERFDKLFTVEGEQLLIREQNHWIAPNRLRVVWRQQTEDVKPAIASEPGRTPR